MPGPSCSVPPGFEVLAPGVLGAPIPLVSSVQIRSIISVQEPYLEDRGPVQLPVPVHTVPIPDPGVGHSTDDQDWCGPMQCHRGGTDMARQRKVHSLSTIVGSASSSPFPQTIEDFQEVLDGVLAAIQKVAREHQAASISLQDPGPCTSRAFQDVSGPFAISSSSEAQRTKDRGASKTRELKASGHMGSATRSHGKLQDHLRDVQDFERPCLSAQQPDRPLEGSGHLPRALTMSGRDRDRDRSIRGELAPQESRSHRPWHEHLDD